MERPRQLVRGDGADALALVGTNAVQAYFLQRAAVTARYTSPGAPVDFRQQLPEPPPRFESGLVRWPDGLGIVAVPGLTHRLLDRIRHGEQFHGVFSRISAS
jgi:hypothetical protein